MNNPSANFQQMCIDRINTFKAVNACVLSELADTMQKMMMQHFECMREAASDGSTASTPNPVSFPTRPPPINCTNGCPDLRSQIDANAICNMTVEMLQQMASRPMGNMTGLGSGEMRAGGMRAEGPARPMMAGPPRRKRQEPRPMMDEHHPSMKTGPELDGARRMGGGPGMGGGGMCSAGGQDGMEGMEMMSMQQSNNPCAAFGHDSHPMHNHMRESTLLPSLVTGKLLGMKGCSDAGHLDAMNKHFHVAEQCGCPGAPGPKSGSPSSAPPTPSTSTTASG